jgi:hypothetical protein
MGKRTCVHAHNGYSVSLSMYTAAQLTQVRAGQLGQEITSSCPHLPETGKAMLVFDLSPALGDAPMAILVKDTNDAASRIVLEVPPLTYPFRVVNVEMSFDRPGNYMAVLQFYTSNAQAARLSDSTFDFPLRVGPGQPEMLRGIALCTMLALLGGGLAVYAARRRQQRKV